MEAHLRENVEEDGVEEVAENVVRERDGSLK